MSDKTDRQAQFRFRLAMIPVGILVGLGVWITGIERSYLPWISGIAGLIAANVFMGARERSRRTSRPEE